MVHDESGLGEGVEMISGVVDRFMIRVKRMGTVNLNLAPIRFDGLPWTS